MIRACNDADLPAILEIINDGALAYRGHVPAPCLSDPYMAAAHLRHEIADGVVFHGFEQNGRLQGVMGIQHRDEVTLIRHAYVRTAARNRGIGSLLLTHLRPLAHGPLLIGTWAAASWAIRFYEKHGFHVLDPEQTRALLARYWNVPDGQVDASVVLAEDCP